MIGKIYIKGDIGSYEDELGNLVKGVDLQDIVSTVKEERDKGATEFEVEIDSPGGFCHVGYDIHAFLKTIPEKITTIAVNQCASIATVIFLAGDEREARCPLMIHNPWISKVSGDADEIQSAADAIRAEEDKLIAFYSKVTGIEKIALDALMKQETYIYPDMAFKLGFTTINTTEKINEPVAYKAVAKIRENMSKESKEFMGKVNLLLEKVSALIKGSASNDDKPKNLTVSADSGESLDITKPDGSEVSESPMVGDVVMIGGAPAPDGAYTITEMGMVIDVLLGAIASIKPIQAADPNAKMIEELKKENATLKEELENSKKDILDASAKFKTIEESLAKMTGKPLEGIQGKAHFRQTELTEKTVEEIKKEKEERKLSYKK